MRKSLLLTLILFIIISAGVSQDYVDYAKKLKKEYPDEEVIITKSDVTIEFDYKSKLGVVVYDETINEFVGLKKNFQFLYPVFYADDIEIRTFKTGGYSRVGRDDYYTSDNIFHDDVKVKYSHYKIPLFGGSSDIKYELFYQDVKYLPVIYFCETLPILKKEIKFIIPDFIDIELIPRNFNGYKITRSVETDKNEKIITFRAIDLEPISDDFDLPGKSHIYPHIIIHAKSYTRDGKKHNILNDLSDQYGWYNSLTSDIGNDPSSLKEIVNGLTSGKTSDDEKIQAIYYWVQDNIRYIAFEDGIAGFKPASCQKVYKNRYGDCKGMANLTKEMLKLAGYDARLAWIGTRHLAFDYSIPSLAADNHMICALKTDNSFVFLDATQKYSRLGDYSENIQGREVLIEDGDNYILDEIPVATASMNQEIYNLNLEITEDLDLAGEIDVTLMGESRVQLVNIINHIPSKDWEKAIKYFLKAGDKNINITDVNMPDPDRNKDYIFSSKISIPERLSTFDNDTYAYINPFTFFASYDVEKDRKFPLWFDYKNHVNVNIIINNLGDWQITHIPEDLIIENDEFSLKLIIENQNNSISYHFELINYIAEISSQNLENWNKSISILNEAYEQPIILQKR